MVLPSLVAQMIEQNPNAHERTEIKKCSTWNCSYGMSNGLSDSDLPDIFCKSINSHRFRKYIILEAY